MSKKKYLICYRFLNKYGVDSVGNAYISLKKCIKCEEDIRDIEKCISVSNKAKALVITNIIRVKKFGI